MSSRAKIIFLFFTMILTLILAGYVSFAWFSMIETTKPITFTTGTLKSNTSFYRGIDSDLDGVLDNGEYQQIFQGGIQFTNVIPGQIYTFKINFRNEGTIQGLLTLTMNGVIGTNTDILEGFTVRYVDPNTEEIVTITLDQNQNDAILLFTDHILEPLELFTFHFTLEANENLSVSSKNQTLTINNYIIQLDQIQE